MLWKFPRWHVRLIFLFFFMALQITKKKWYEKEWKRRYPMTTSKKANNIIHGTHIRLLYIYMRLFFSFCGRNKKSENKWRRKNQFKESLLWSQHLFLCFSFCVWNSLKCHMEFTNKFNFFFRSKFFFFLFFFFISLLVVSLFCVWNKSKNEKKLFMYTYIYNRKQFVEVLYGGICKKVSIHDEKVCQRFWLSLKFWNLIACVLIVKGI